MNLPPTRSIKLLAAVCISLAFATVGNVGAPKGKPKPPPKIACMAIASVDPKAMTIPIEPKNSTATGSKVYKHTAQTKVTATDTTARSAM